MANFEVFERITMAFPEVTVEPHFEKLSFRVKNKIFATYDEQNNRLTVKLSEIDQDNFTSINSGVYQVNNKLGKQGWTFIELSTINYELLAEVLKTAYCEVAPKKLSEQV